MTIEQDCLAILAHQMGPAARVFLDRQCRRLGKTAETLQQVDLPELAKLCFNGTQTTLGVAVAESIKKSILEVEIK